MRSDSRRGDFELLARVRRGLRSIDNAIARGAVQADLTLQQQAFLLAVRAYGGRDVPFADIREELEMDAATASLLLARLLKMKLVTRRASDDRRASRISLTAHGRMVFADSVERIRAEIRGAEHRGELSALRRDLGLYLRYYLPRAKTAQSRPRPRGRRSSTNERA